MPGIAIHAYTATATIQVREDMIQELELSDPEVLVGSFDRPNLSYKIMLRDGGTDQMATIMDRHRDESGIIYCISTK